MYFCVLYSKWYYTIESCAKYPPGTFEAQQLSDICSQTRQIILIIKGKYGHVTIILLFKTTYLVGSFSKYIYKIFKGKEQHNFNHIKSNKNNYNPISIVIVRVKCQQCHTIVLQRTQIFNHLIPSHPKKRHSPQHLVFLLENFYPEK